MLTDLINFPLSCIYGFTDDNNGVFLQFSNNALCTMSVNLTSLKRGIHDCRPLQDAYNRGVLQLKLFKSYDAPFQDIVARAECSFIIKSGYTDLSGTYTNTTYAITKQVRSSYVSNLNDPLIYMLAKSRSHGAIVVGIFDNMVVAKSWVQENYSNPGSIDALVFMDNALTRDYHLLYGYKLVTKRLGEYDIRYKPRPLRKGFTPTL